MVITQRLSNNVISEYYKLKRNLILTSDEILALKEREFYFNNQNLFKRCLKCGKIKHISMFYKNPLKKQGVFDTCKACEKERAKLRRENENIAKRKGNIETFMLAKSYNCEDL